MYKYFSFALALGFVAISFAGTIHVPADYPTIQQAINAANDGDIIMVAPGTYNISSTILNNRVNNLQLLGSREEDGSNASIINAAVNPGMYVAIKFFGVNGCTISGFEVKNAHSGISLENCKNCLITRNYIHDNDQATSWHGDGIEIFRCENIDVTFNIIAHNEFHGIELQYQVKNINIINNTILQTYGHDGIALYDYLVDVTIKNNIIAYSNEEGIELVYLWPGSPVNFINDYNCFWQNGGGPIRPPFTIGPHSVLADPLLVDIPNHNYYPQPNSPCLGSGEGGTFIGALGLPNEAPVADAGTDQTIEATSPSGAEVNLDGSDSHDPDGDPLTHTWRENSTIIAGPTSSPTSQVTLALGSHTIELTVDDGKGGTDDDEVLINIVDTTPPSLTVALNPNVLWPPNHKMVAIHATVTISDAVDPNPTFVLTSIESNEPDNSLGDGDKPNDIQEADCGTPDLDFKLRAERSGKGDGRIYTVTYRATDASGNETSTSATVTVPHDMGQLGSAPTNYDLFANRPNPFNQETEISFQLPAAEHTVLKIFNTLGQEIRTIVDQPHEAGHHSVRWDGRDNNGNLVVSGTYFYQIKAGDFVATKKLVVLK